MYKIYTYINGIVNICLISAYLLSSAGSNIVSTSREATDTE